MIPSTKMCHMHCKIYSNLQELCIIIPREEQTTLKYCFQNLKESPMVKTVSASRRQNFGMILLRNTQPKAWAQKVDHFAKIIFPNYSSTLIDIYKSGCHIVFQDINSKTWIKCDSHNCSKYHGLQSSLTGLFKSYTLITIFLISF